MSEQGLFGSLNDILEKIQQSIERIAERYETQKREDPAQVQVRGEIEPRLPTAVTDYYQSQQAERRINESRERHRFVLECVGVIVGAGILILASATWWVFKGQLTEMNTQTRILKTEAIQAAKDAAETRDRSERQLHTDLRAWVGPSRFRRPEQSAIQPMAALVFEAVFLNSGRTPALSVVTKARTRFMGSKEDFEPLYEQESGRQSATAVQPGGETTAPIGKSFTQTEIEDIKAGKLVFYFYGYVHYKDVFDGATTHEATFCTFMLPSLAGLANCDRYNNAN